MNRRWFVLVLLAAAALWAVPQQSQPQSAAAQTNLGVIRGSVTRKGTLEPIPDVLISLIPLTGGTTGGFGAVARGGAAAGTLMVKSDSAGLYVFKDLPSGQWTVRAELEGYFGSSSNGTNPTFVSANVVTSAGQESVVPLSLIPGSVINGLIVDSGGRPMVNVSVQALRMAYQLGFATLQSIATGTTNDRGEYRLFRIPPGEYYVGVSPLQAGFRGARGARGFGLPEQREGPVRTFYPREIDIERAQRIQLKGGEEISGININVQSATTTKITGQVTSAFPIAGRTGPRGNLIAPSASLLLIPRDRNAMVDPNATTVGSISLDGPAVGQFEIAGVLPGSYDLFARINNPDVVNVLTAGTVAANVTPYYFGRTSFEARDQDIQGLSITLRPGVELNLSASVDGIVSASAGITRISLLTDDSARLLPLYQGTRTNQVIGEGGTMTIAGVYEGLYRFQVNIAPNGGARGTNALNLRDAYVEDIREGGASVYDNGLRVGTQTPGLIEVILKTNGGTAEGIVYDAAMSPKAGATVVLIPPPHRRQNPALYKTAQTNPAGRFTIRGIAPGNYKLFAWNAVPATAYQNAAFLSKYEERGQSVTVASASTTASQLSLILEE